ncbi:hypothetical protein, partial [Mitsuokella jalaludinii]|uniref:hypothetical protein n=1 Tax=Mitsuokella jalaludinii TaxID=187979 RepID=UPI00307F1722
CDSLINSQVLYRLSYRGISTTSIIVEGPGAFVNTFFHFSPASTNLFPQKKDQSIITLVFSNQSKKSLSLRLRLG